MDTHDRTLTDALASAISGASENVIALVLMSCAPDRLGPRSAELLQRFAQDIGLEAQDGTMDLGARVSSYIESHPLERETISALATALTEHAAAKQNQRGQRASKLLGMHDRSEIESDGDGTNVLSFLLARLADSSERV